MYSKNDKNSNSKHCKKSNHPSNINLHRSKSTLQEDDYDCVIIEEYSYNSPKRHPKVKKQPGAPKLTKAQSIAVESANYDEFIIKAPNPYINKNLEKYNPIQPSEQMRVLKNIDYNGISGIANTEPSVKHKKENAGHLTTKVSTKGHGDFSDEICEELEVINRGSDAEYVKIERHEIESIPQYAKHQYKRNRKIHH